MSRYYLLIIALTAGLASGCAANQPGAGSALGEKRYSQEGHARYYEEIRAPTAFGVRGVECGVR